MGVNVRSFLLNTSNHFSHPYLNSIFIIAFFCEDKCQPSTMEWSSPSWTPLQFISYVGRVRGHPYTNFPSGDPGRHLTNVAAHHWILRTHLSYSCCLPFALTFAPRTNSSSSFSSSLTPFCTFLVVG